MIKKYSKLDLKTRLAVSKLHTETLHWTINSSFGAEHIMNLYDLMVDKELGDVWVRFSPSSAPIAFCALSRNHRKLSRAATSMTGPLILRKFLLRGSGSLIQRTVSLLDAAIVHFYIFYIFRKETLLVSWGVAPSERSKGVGRELLNVAAKESDASDVVVDVSRKAIPALHSYRLLGFQQVVGTPLSRILVKRAGK